MKLVKVRFWNGREESRLEDIKGALRAENGSRGFNVALGEGDKPGNEVRGYKNIKTSNILKSTRIWRNLGRNFNFWRIFLQLHDFP